MPCREPAMPDPAAEEEETFSVQVKLYGHWIDWRGPVSRRALDGEGGPDAVIERLRGEPAYLTEPVRIIAWTPRVIMESPGTA